MPLFSISPNEMKDLVLVSDDNIKFAVLDLEAVELPGIGFYVGVKGFSPRCSEALLDHNFLAICDRV